MQISWINENMAVGAALPTSQLPFLAKEGVGCIVDVRSEYKDDEGLIRKLGLDFLHVGVDDRYSPTIEQLQKIFSFVKGQMAKGRKIFIHCQNGCGRSPLVAMAILIMQGTPTPEAVNIVEARHPQTGFTLNQERFIYTLEERLKERRR